MLVGQSMYPSSLFFQVSFSSIGSRSPGRLSFTGSIPIIGQYSGEELEAVNARRKLAIYKHRTEILRNIDQNVVMMVAGDPGCGKTIHGRTDIVKCLLSHGADQTMKVSEA
jgi:hypothetical protein